MQQNGPTVCRLRKAVVTAALFAAAGCGAQASSVKTYPVRGKVSLSDGRPFPGGLIEFRSAAHPAATVKGIIAKDDGSFSLTTLIVVGNRNQTSPKAPPGDYRVTIIPTMQQGEALTRPVLLPKPYQVKARDDNEFTLRVEPPPGGR